MNFQHKGPVTQERFPFDDVIMCGELLCITSVWPNDAMKRNISGSSLAQVMACFLTTTSHYHLYTFFKYHRILHKNATVLYFQYNNNLVLSDTIMQDRRSTFFSNNLPQCRIYASEIGVSIGSDDGVSPIRRQAIM